MLLKLHSFRKVFFVAMFIVAISSLLGAAMWIAPIAPAMADPPTPGGNETEPDGFEFGPTEVNEVGRILLMLFVLALLLETGLATLFNWRLFVRYGEGRGIKIPIAVIVSFLFIKNFKIDAVAGILNAFSKEGAEFSSGLGGLIITALIVAGGSSTVFRLWERLQLRNSAAQREAADEMRRHSNLKVQVKRVNVPLSQRITLKLDGQIIGAIEPNNNLFGGILGYQIAPGDHKLEISAPDDKGQVQSQTRSVPVAAGATAVESFNL